MDNEKAIRVLEEFKVIDDWTAIYLPQMEDAVDMAIEALKERNSSDSLLTEDDEACKEQKSKLDLIDRQLALAKVRIRLQDWAAYGNEEYRRGLYACEDMIISLPSAEPKTGEWVLKGHLWECDQCGCRTNRANPLKGNIWNYNYCPNCGARMKGADDEADNN